MFWIQVFSNRFREDNTLKYDLKLEQKFHKYYYSIPLIYGLGLKNYLDVLHGIDNQEFSQFYFNKLFEAYNSKYDSRSQALCVTTNSPKKT